MFHTKYRPKNLLQFYGNEEVVSAIKLMLKDEIKPYAFLITGEKGTGKTTLARIIAKKLGASDLSLTELNSADMRGIDTSREIINTSAYSTFFGDVRVYIFDEAHSQTREAQEALLKLLESPPRRTHYIFCTTNPEKMLDTLKRRCVHYHLKPLSFDERKRLFDTVAKKEKIEYDDDVRELIVEESLGNPSMLLLYMYECRGLTYEQARSVIRSHVDDTDEDIIELCRMFLKPQRMKWSKIISAIDAILERVSAETLRLTMYSYYTTMLKKAKTDEDILFSIAILEEIDSPVYDNANGNRRIIYMLARVYATLKGL